MSSKKSRSPTVRLTAAKAEAKKPTKVIPSWMTARKRPGWAISRRTRRADRLPSSTSCSMRVRRTVTRAISAAPKTPLIRMRTTMTRISPRVAPRRRGRGAGADEGAVADDRTVLARAVVVGGDGARADVHARADLGVAAVAAVVLLGARTPAALLHLGVVAELGAPADRGARAQVGEGPDGHLVLDLARLEHAGTDPAALAHDAVADLAAGADERLGADPRPATEDDVGLDDDVLAELDHRVDEDGGGGLHGHSGPQGCPAG